MVGGFSMVLLHTCHCVFGGIPEMDLLFGWQRLVSETIFLLLPFLVADLCRDLSFLESDDVFFDRWWRKWVWPGKLRLAVISQKSLFDESFWCREASCVFFPWSFFDLCDEESFTCAFSLGRWGRVGGFLAVLCLASFLYMLCYWLLLSVFVVLSLVGSFFVIDSYFIFTSVGRSDDGHEWEKLWFSRRRDWLVSQSRQVKCFGKAG